MQGRPWALVIRAMTHGSLFDGLSIYPYVFSQSSFSTLLFLGERKGFPFLCPLSLLCSYTNLLPSSDPLRRRNNPITRNRGLLVPTNFVGLLLIVTMDSSSVPNAAVSVYTDKESTVDPFLVEALQNPRHRLTILRMELDIQRFLNNTDQQHFEFQHFPTSYLRLAAHRVAQHYGMQTLVQDNGLDGQGTRIMVRKLAESRYPVVRLSEIPTKQLENDKPEQVKIVIRPRPNKSNSNEANEAGKKSNPLRSVEERKEEYDRARARIFSSSRSCDSGDTLSLVSTDEKNSFINKDDSETSKTSMADSESGRDINSTRVAIFRDREKDRSDPDYDRSYGRYARSIPTPPLNLIPFNLQQVQPSFAQYDTTFNLLNQMSQNQASLGYVPPSSQINPFGVTSLNQASRDATYLQWPNATMMYAHSYDQFRHAVFQAPFGQQPLSFDCSQNY
ncbi:hypothetical protein RJT34_24036 [Clitoria ternatea]|uniref:R3H domain-containing protein 2 n=1 Tax=Clitoria ternatea TaxID=43366 RepID=A0AAN9IIX2_CLITE